MKRERLQGEEKEKKRETNEIRGSSFLIGFLTSNITDVQLNMN